MGDKPRVVVFGGCGFIGRHLVSFLYKNSLCSHLRVVDKVIPEMSWMTEEHASLYEKVDFVQHNLLLASSGAEIYQLPSGEKFDYAFNVSGETKVGLDDDLYTEGIIQLTKNIGKNCLQFGVGKLIEVSTAMLYSSTPKIKTEQAKLEPWTKIANCKLQAEEALRSIEKLNVVFMRPSIVYGDGDRQGLAPRIVTGAVYKHLGKKLKFLWTGELMVNTVHVSDLCQAMWLVAQKAPSQAIYNISDKNFTDQQKINVLLEKVFGIETGYANKITSQLIKMLSLDALTQEVNDGHVAPWLELCKKSSVTATPLTPYLSSDFLGNNNLFVDGSLIEKELGFKYENPTVEEASIRSWIKYFREQNAFPDGMTT